jgi:hypothetical protein
MTIGNLYDANNVVVGQAAAFIAASGTPLPAFDKANLADPFDPTPFVSYTLTVSPTSTWTLSYGGQATSSLADTSTSAEIETALAALSTVGAGNVTVTGTTGGPYTVLFDEQVSGKTFTATMTTGTVPTISGGLWTAVGATDQGWKFGTNKSTQAITIEEQSTPVSQAITSQNVTIEGALSEDISRTLALAWNAYVTSTAAAAGVPGYDEVTLTDDVLYYAVCLVSSNDKGYPKWTYAPKWSQLSNASTDFRRAAGKHMYPVIFETLCKPSQITTVNFQAPGS